MYKHDKNGQYSIYRNSGYGPTFGGGHDMYLANGCKSNTASYSNLQHSYATQQNFNEPKNEALTGSYYFTVNEYEVFAPFFINLKK